MTVQSSSPRRTVAGPLVLALVFLAIIGGSVGAVLGLRADSDPDGGGHAGNGAATGTRPTGDSTQPGTEPAPRDRACPAVTDQAARAEGSPGGLSYLLYIRTDQSEVWICRDTAGRLWYQGHRHLGSPTVDLPAPTSDNTLFLTDIRAEPDQGYVATNAGRTGTTYYRVSRTWLVIDNPGEANDHREQVREYDAAPA